MKQHFKSGRPVFCAVRSENDLRAVRTARVSSGGRKGDVATAELDGRKHLRNFGAVVNAPPAMPQGLQAETRPLPRVVQWAPTAHRPGRRDAGAQATVDIVQDSHQPFGPAAVVPGKQALRQARPRLEPSQHHAGLLIRQALPRQAHEAPQFQGRPFADDADWARAVRVIDASDLAEGAVLNLNANTLKQKVVCYLGTPEAWPVPAPPPSSSPDPPPSERFPRPGAAPRGRG